MAPNHFLTLELLLLASYATAKISKATCTVTCDPTSTNCEGFLASLPLRSGIQILTTALITGLLAAWQSCGSGQGGLFRGLARTILQAFIPEIALFQLRQLGYAMDPEFEGFIDQPRRRARCADFAPTKSQIVAVHLRSLAVRADWGGGGMTQVAGAPPPSAPVITDPASLLKYVSESNGWKDVTFHEALQPGYRLVTLPEAVFLPHLFFTLPKGRKTVLGTPIFQPAMVLLVIQALYYIISTCVRTSQKLYTTSLEWFFIPTSITLILIFSANILWEPAWKDIAHVSISLGPHPLPQTFYPWSRGDVSHFWIGGVLTVLVVPIGPITTLVAFITEVGKRPKVTEIVLILGAILWTGGFLVLGVLTLMGRYRPFGGRNPWVRYNHHEEGEVEEEMEAQLKSEMFYEMWFSTVLILARMMVLVSALYEMAYLPADAYRQMSWAQYFPHI